MVHMPQLDKEHPHGNLLYGLPRLANERIL